MKIGPITQPLHPRYTRTVLIHLTVMTILTHGSDLTLAPAVRPLVKASGKPLAAAVADIAAAGFTAVQLDAALPGLRPRDLDQRARKDLLALLTRRSLRLAGLDLFIPRAHFLDPKHLDRATSAVTAAIGLAADLGRVPLSVPLPIEDLDEAAASAIIEAADGHAVPLAVHAEDRVRKLIDWLDATDLPTAGAAIDPAALFAHGVDPVTLAHRIGKRLTVARLSDARQAHQDTPDHGITRCPVGRGDLDVAAYRVALDLITSRPGPVVLDLAGLTAPAEAAAQAAACWDQSAFAS